MSIFNYNSVNSENINNDLEGDNYTPILVLKELVASLQKEQNKIQNLLSSLSFALRSFNNLNQFLELTPLMVARVTDGEGGALILYSKDHKVNLEQIYCQNHQYREEIISSFETVVKELNIYQEKKVKTKDFLPEIDSFSSFIQDRFREELSPLFKIFSTPILIKNIERGRLYIFSQDSDYLWTQTRKKLAQLVADQTAVAIANHELTVELRSKERQDRELEIASEIQSRLLPRKCPIIKGLQIAAKCQTANRVGGDYYDFIPVNYDQWSNNHSQIANAPCEPWSIVIGDVMGKGVPAGLIMTMTRGMLRAEVLNRHSPAQVLEHLNRVMYADLDNSHRFVTLFYSEYDPQSHTLKYANAAHNPPLLWRKQTQKITRLDTDGMLIGLQSDSKYEDDCINLQVNDIILYYTDGLTDAVNQNNQRFDEDNLHICFDYACQNYDSAEDILHYIFRKIEEFIGFGHKNTDDMTLIVVKFDPNDSIVCAVRQ